MKFALARLVMLAALAVGLSVPAPAATVSRAAVPAPAHAVPAPSTGELKNLLQTLRDPAQRQILMGQIEALVAARQAEGHAGPGGAAAKRQGLGSAFVALLSSRVQRIGATLAATASLTPLTDLAAWGHRVAQDPALRLAWIKGLATLIGVIGLAFLAERGVDAALAASRRRLRATAALPFWMRALGVLGEILLRWVPLLAFLVAGYALLALALAMGGSEEAARAAVLAILEARVLARAIVIVVAAVLAPQTRDAGLLHLDEETANYWLIWLTRLVYFAVYSSYALDFARQVGLSAAADDFIVKILGLAFAGLLIMLLLQNRAVVAHAIAGRKPGHDASALGRVRGGLAQGWHLAAILYVLGSYVVWVADIPGGFAFLLKATVLSAVVLILAGFGAVGGTALVNRLLTIRPDLSQRLPDLQKRVNLYGPLLIGIGRGLIYAITTLLVLQIWGLDVVTLLASAAGRRVIGAMIIIAVTAAASVVAWEVVGFFIQLYLSRPGADGAPIERSARMRTLLPLFRKTLAVLLSIAVALVVLSELGVDIGPLLAGAGIAGIAVGFGAQTLVKDVITGLFILMQDAVAVGDVVTVAGSSGLVEQISIRSIRLRDLDGTVVIIPFSEVSTVRNMTKEYSYALFDVGISYREDVDAVVPVLVELAETMRAEPDFAWRILEPIEILGLDKFADSAVIIKARIKTRPIQQWNVMREYNRRLKKRFDELDIEMPFPHRTLYFGVDKKGAAPPAHIVAEGGPVAARPVAPEAETRVAEDQRV